mgnify:CR=1 FL=1
MPAQYDVLATGGTAKAKVELVESLFGPPAPGGSRRGSLGTIVDRIRAGEEVPVFVDRTVSPSHTPDIARAVRALVETHAPKEQDPEIWDLGAVASFFNMSNRVATATDMRPNSVYHGMAR